MHPAAWRRRCQMDTRAAGRHDPSAELPVSTRRLVAPPATTIGEVACPCDTESVEITRWAVNAAGSCDRAPESRLACSRRLWGTASRPKMICCEHIGQSVSTWDLGMRADGSMRAEAGIALSYLALTSTAATRPGMAK